MNKAAKNVPGQSMSRTASELSLAGIVGLILNLLLPKQKGKVSD